MTKSRSEGSPLGTRLGSLPLSLTPPSNLTQKQDSCGPHSWPHLGVFLGMPPHWPTGTVTRPFLSAVSGETGLGAISSSPSCYCFGVGQGRAPLPR